MIDLLCQGQRHPGVQKLPSTRTIPSSELWCVRRFKEKAERNSPSNRNTVRAVREYGYRCIPLRELAGSVRGVEHHYYGLSKLSSDPNRGVLASSWCADDQLHRSQNNVARQTGVETSVGGGEPAPDPCTAGSS